MSSSRRSSSSMKEGAASAPPKKNSSSGSHIRLPSAGRLRRISEYLRFRGKRRTKSLGTHNFWGLRKSDPLQLWQEIVVDAALFAALLLVTYGLTWMCVELSASEYDCRKNYFGFACVKNCSDAVIIPGSTECERHAGEIGIDLVFDINWMLLISSALSICSSLYIVHSFTVNKRMSGKLHLKLLCSMAATDAVFSFKFFFSSFLCSLETQL